MKYTVSMALVGVLAATTFAFTMGDKRATASSAQVEQNSVEANQQRLITSIPAPTLQTSLERKNLVERLERINKQNMMGCIYLISHGTVMSFYPVRGKVTSLNAYLMGGEKIVRDPNTTIDTRGSVLIEQPDYDGAYGKNADGVFFFTADTNAYVEWSGEYLWSDQCLSPAIQPTLIREVK